MLQSSDKSRSRFLKQLICLVFLGQLVTNIAQAQVATIQNQYYLNPYIYNPALLGSNDHTQLFLGVKKQWTGVEGAPTVATFTYEKPLENRASIGGRLVNVSEGPINSLSAQATLGYRLEVGLESYLNFGMSLGFIYNAFNANALDAANDPLVQEQNNGVFNFDGGVGFSYHSGGLQLGLALPQFAAPRPFANNNDPQTNYSPWDYLIGSIVYKLEPDLDWELVPMFLYHVQKGFNHQWEVALKTIYQKKVTIGGMYRQNAGLTAFAGFNLSDSFGFHYLYSFSSPTAQLPNDSHELVLRLIIGEQIKR